MQAMHCYQALRTNNGWGMYMGVEVFCIPSKIMLKGYYTCVCNDKGLQ